MSPSLIWSFLLTRFRISLVGLFSAFGMILCLITLVSFGGRWSWKLDLLSNFRVQYLVSLLLITATLFVFRKWRTAGVCGACAAINLALILPYYFGKQDGGERSETPIRVALINVLTANRHSDLVRQFVIKNQPDIVFFEEVDDWWNGQLSELRKIYPHWVSEPRGDNFGIAFASKLPLDDCRIVHIGKVGVPSVSAKFRSGGKRWSFLGTHPVPPGGKDGSRFRNDQLVEIAHHLSACESPIVLLGDLNASPWSHHFRRLLTDTGLRDSARGFGIHPTWPTPMDWLPLPSILLRIPIDHCLVSPKVRVLNRYVGEFVGSDHYPLVVDLSFEE